jgi:hypothetical protein
MMKARTISFLSIGFLALMLVSMLGSSTVSTIAERDLTPRGYNCYFAAPTSGETISGQYTVRFIGDYNGNPLYRVLARVYQGNSKLTDYFDMTQVTSFEWQIGWDTETFDDGDNYRIRAIAYRAPRRRTALYSGYCTIDNSGPADTEPPTVSITAPSNGATVSGTISITATASDNVGVTKVSCRIDSGSWMDDTTSPYSWTWDTTSVSDGSHTITCRAYDAAGNYADDSVTVTVDNGDTTPPTVTITAPSNGATVSGTVDITASASDNVGVDYVQCRIDSGSWVDDTSSPYSWTWDTTGESDGSHTITCRAWDAAGNYADDQITVTVDNSGGGENELTSGETVYSSLAAQYDTEMWTIQVGANCESMHSVLNCGSADFDLYGRLGAEPTTSTYDWRGYTYGGEDVLYDYPGEGTWYIMVRSYSGTGAYDLTVTLDYGSPPEPWGNGGKYAIIVGISDYGYISDLSYCDEDATDWYNQLNSMGWECRVYGDGHTGDYPRYDGKATESVVRNAMQGLAAHAQSGDKVAFITSGHGSGDGSGSSYLCMWDCSGSAGCYYDTELAADVGLFASGCDIFVFIDHCYSGGMGPELMALSNSDDIYCATTCTEDGYGWDSGANQNGLWTYYFLDYSWQSHFGSNPTQSMESVFQYAHDNYPYQAPSGDEPQEFDGNSGSYFYLN